MKMKASSQMAGTLTRQAALRYGELGIPVFPCNPKNKRPFTDHGFKDATTDRAQINEWWNRWPDAMIGMPTGERSGIDVLDLDVDAGKGKNGKAEFPNYAELSEIVVSSPRTGAHVYFKRDPTNPIKNSTDQIALGVDTRGDGGYVILPPSRNGIDRGYQLTLPAVKRKSRIATITDPDKINNSPPGSKYFCGWISRGDRQWLRIIIWDQTRYVEDRKDLIKILRGTGDIQSDGEPAFCDIENPKHGDEYFSDGNPIFEILLNGGHDALILRAADNPTYRVLVDDYLKTSIPMGTKQ
jgi:hypothetical protein